MLIASCGLLDAAFGRFPALPLVLSPTGVDALICLGVIRDLIVERRVHEVYLYALSILDRLPNRRHGDIHPCFAVVDEYRQPHRALVC
jgi:hypothetical protein